MSLLLIRSAILNIYEKMLNEDFFLTSVQMSEWGPSLPNHQELIIQYPWNGWFCARCDDMGWISILKIKFRTEFFQSDLV